MLENIIKDIKEAQGLINLDLELEDIDDDGVRLLSEAIKEAKVPVSLFLASTALTTEGLRSLSVMWSCLLGQKDSNYKAKF
jgi:hypothetical protein